MNISDYYVVSCHYDKKHGPVFETETVAEMLKRHRLMTALKNQNTYNILSIELSQDAADAAVEEFEYIFKLPKQERMAALQKLKTEPPERPSCPKCGNLKTPSTLKSS